MSVRTSAVSSLVLGLALALSPCATAHAATGTFTYSYPVPGGTRTSGLLDPGSGRCLNIPEVHNTDDSAHTPVNRTDSMVTVFTGTDCTGDYYSLRPGGKASSRLLLKSAVFS